MKKILMILTFAVLPSLAMAETADADQKHKLTEGTNTHVLIVSGINKEPNEHDAKDRAVLVLRKYFLNNAKISRNRLRILVDGNSSARKYGQVSTAENLKKEILSLAASIKPADRFIFYYVGQANIVTGKLRLNLPGKDLTHEQLSEWINEIKASSTLVVLDCPGAGLAIKGLAGPGRIIICGATSEQPYSTRFSEYFVPALSVLESDENGDGRICLLEAFTYACKQLDDLYQQQGLLKTETPLLEDDGDGVPSQRPWRYKENKKDGFAASRFFLSGK